MHITTPFSDADLSFVGQGLVRPECVLCLKNGRVITANFEGGVSIIETSGDVWHLLGQTDFELKPNGICLLKDGSFLIAHLGADDGGVYRLFEDGRVTPFLLTVDGVPLPPTNFIHRDVVGRTWITVSTRQRPRSLGYQPDVADGFIVLVDDKGAHIVADNLGFANECLVHPDGKHLFVNETFARRLSVFKIGASGTLTRVVTHDNFGSGEFPDGLAFDTDGGLWIACIVSNRLIRIGADGDRNIMLDGCDQAHVAWVETAYQQSQVGPEHLGKSNGAYGNVSSLAFGGDDRRTIFLGNLLESRLGYFSQSFVGTKPVHWDFAGPQRDASNRVTSANRAES